MATTPTRFGRSLGITVVWPGLPVDARNGECSCPSVTACTSKSQKYLPPMTHAVYQHPCYFLPGTHHGLQSWYLRLDLSVTFAACHTGRRAPSSSAQILAWCLSHNRCLINKCWVNEEMSPGTHLHSLITLYHFRNISLNLRLLLGHMGKGMLCLEREQPSRTRKVNPRDDTIG